MAGNEFSIPIWPGSSSFSAGLTPFGFYDTDPIFVGEADKFADWATRRLGYPITDIELQDINLYAAFEEAITEYSAFINQQNIIDNLLNIQGMSTGSDLNGTVINSSLGNIIELATDYGSEAGSGGNITWRTGSIAIKRGVQNYDLNALYRDIKEPGEELEIKRFFHAPPPAIVRYFDPFLDTGLGSQNLLDQFSWGNFSPAVTFLMMPVYQDLLRLQAIEFNDTIRKSQFGFEIINNNLRIFPIPNSDFNVHFDYIRKSDRGNAITSTVSGSSSSTTVSDSSNAPYTFINYNTINSVGKRWIYRFGAALAKETLGWVRSKYSAVPIPNAEVTLNGPELLSEAANEKQALIEELKGDLEKLSREAQIEKNKNESEYLQEQLNKVPLKIYIG